MLLNGDGSWSFRYVDLRDAWIPVQSGFNASSACLQLWIAWNQKPAVYQLFEFVSPLSCAADAKLGYYITPSLPLTLLGLSLQLMLKISQRLVPARRKGEQHC